MFAYIPTKVLITWQKEWFISVFAVVGLSRQFIVFKIKYVTLKLLHTFDKLYLLLHMPFFRIILISAKCKKRLFINSFNSSCSRNFNFGNQKNENLLRNPKFYGRNEFFLPNCEKTEPGTTFLKISLDLAYSIDSKKGLTFENPIFNNWLISKTVFD